MHIKPYGSNTSYMLFVTIVLFTYTKCQKCLYMTSIFNYIQIVYIVALFVHRVK